MNIMKKKNGFIAISILYSFFLCFVALMMGLLASYANSSLILHKINTPIKYNNKDFEMLLYDLILNNTLETSTPNFAYGAPNTILPSNKSGLFKSSDDDGTTYYFRGNITNNYVSFGDFIWRVVRINGDVTIRLIYDGTTAHINGEDSADRYVGTSAFNTSYSNPKYVGYTYLDNDGIVQDSTMKKYLDNWYQTNIIDKGLDGYVAESIYCNDTTIYSNENNKLEFQAKYRNYNTDENTGDKQTTLQCSDTEQSYGGYYKLKIGLLSADELIMAGYGKNKENATKSEATNYLYSSDNFWTMSPSDMTNSEVYMLNGDDGLIKNDYSSVYDTLIVKPVINLKEDVLVLTGDGTKDSPYVIDTN